MSTGRLVVAAVGLALLGFMRQTAEAGAITFSPAVTITATTDVSTAGTLKYAHSWALGDRTNNGVKFVGTIANNGTISNNVNLVGFGQQNSTAFNSATAPFGSLPAAYRGILTGAVYGAANTTGSVTLLQLTPGRQYQVQLWVSDPRAGATTSRTQVVTSLGGNSQTMKYNVAAAAGSPGQLVTGSFLVDGTSQLLRVVGVGGFVGGTNLPQVNALQVRELAGGAYWNGLQNGALDESSTNYQGGLSLAQITASVANVYFADQDQLGTAVANTNLTVAAGGLRIPNLVFANTNKRYTVVGSDTNGLSGSSAITVLGAGRAVLAGENTFTGNIIVDKGVLVLQHERALGTSTKTLDVTLTADTGGVELEGGITVPTGIVWQTSNQGTAQPAIRSVSGTNVIAGPIQLTGGGGNTRAVVESGSMLTLAGLVTNIYTGARTLELGGAGAGVVAGTISDGNSTTVLTGVTKDGAGTWILAGTNTFVGGTVVNAGTLALGADATLPSRNIALAGGAVLDVTAPGGFVLAADQTLQGSGLVTGAVSTVDGAKLIPGAPGTVGTLTFGGGLQLGAGATNLFDLGAGTSDVVAVVGDLEPSNAVVRLAALVPPVSGSYPLFTYSGAKATTFDPAVRHFLATRVALSLDETGTVGQVRLVVDAQAAQDLAWNPAVSATWDLGVSNWVDAATRTVTDRFYEADTVLFDDAGAASNVINLATLVRPARVTVDAAADYTFTGAGRIGNPVLGVTSRLVKAGSGSLTVAVSNEFTGGTVISNGAVAVAAAGALGTGAVTLDGGRLAGSGASNTMANAVVVNGAAVGLAAGAGEQLTLTGVMSGPGGLVKTGAGLVNLHPPSPNAYAGGTVVNEGTLRLGFGNGTANQGTIQGELTIQTGAVVWAATDKALGFAASPSGNVTVVRINEGLLNFTGVNGMGGGQTVYMQSGEIRSNGGTNSPAATGYYRFLAGGTNPTLYTLSHAAPAVMSGRVQLDTTAAMDTEDGPASPDLRVDASITGGNLLRKQGAGTLLLTGSNTFTGELAIQTGTLAIGASAVLATPVYRLTSGATLDVSAASGWTVNAGQSLVGGGTVVGGVIARSGSVVRAGGFGPVETLTFANDLGLQAGSTFGFDLTDVPAVGGGTNDLVVVAGRLEPSNTVVVINPLKPLGTGTYTLVTHDGTKTTFFNPAVQGNGSRQSWTLDETTVPTVIALVVTGGFESLVWRPQANAAWDLVSSNWFVTSGSTTDRFYQLDTVLFDDSGAYSNVVAISGALTPQAVTINASSNYTLTGTGAIGGTNGLLKQGAGRLVLNSTNTYTGGTRVEGGVLSVANDGHFGSSAVSNSVTLDGGTLELTANLTPPANRKLVVGPGGGTLTGTGTAGLIAVPEDALKGSGALLITGSSATHTVLQPVGAQSNFSGAITIASGRINLNNAAATLGSGEITVGTGSASLYVTPALTLSNVINIQSDGGETRGAVRLQSGGTLAGPLVLLSNASIGVEGTATGIVNGPITGAYTFTMGPVNAGNDASYHLFASNAQAATVIRKGILGITNDNALGSVGAPLTLASALHATLRALGDGVVVAAARPVALGGAGSSTFDSGVYTMTVAAAMSGTGAVHKAGSGALVLSGGNSYVGSTTVSNGTLVLGAAGALPVGTALALGGGTRVGHLDLAGFSAQVGGLTVGPNTAALNTITINAGQTLAVAGNVSVGNNSGTNTRTLLAVSGAGALAVSGTTFQVGAATGATNFDVVTNDLSQLGTLAIQLGGGTLRVGNVASSSPGVAPFETTLLLASNSLIEAGAIGVGDASGQGANLGRLILGRASNTLHAGRLSIGLHSSTGTRSSGWMGFDQPAGRLVLRGAAGGTNRADVNVLNHSNATATALQAVLDLRGHDADLRMGTVVIASRAAASALSDTGLLAFDTGTLDASSVVIGRRQSGSGVSSGTLDVGGGAVTLGAVTLADSLTAGGTAHGTLTITGGVVTLLGNMRKGASVGSGAAVVNLGGTLRAGADVTNEAAVSLVLTGGVGAAVLDTATNTLVVAGPISGPGGLTKIGAGDLVLSGAGSFSGALVLSNGATYFNGTGTLPGGVTVATAAVLRGSGQLTGAVTVAGGGLLKPGLPAGSAALTVDTLTLGEDAVVQAFAGGTAALVRVAANNAFSATAVGFNYVDVLDASLATGAYPVVDYEGSIQDGDLTAFQLRDVPPRMGLALVENVGNSSLDLSVTSTNESIRWTGAASALWNINTTTNWQTAVGGTPTAYLQPVSLGDAVIFDDSAVGNFSVTVATPVQPVSLAVSNSLNDYAFSGSPIGGATGLDKDGTARLALASSNAFAGATRVRAGTLAIVADVALGADPAALTPSQLVVEAGATLEATSTFALSANRGVVIGTPAAGGMTTLATGTNTLTIPGGLAAQGTATGGLIKTGAGQLTLGAINTYGGPTTVSGGTLLVGGGANPINTNSAVSVAAGATLNLGGNSQMLVGGLTGSGTVTSAAGVLTLVIPATTTNQFDGVLAGGLGLTKSSPGELLLTGASTFSGPIALRAGVLALTGGSDRLPATAQVNVELSSTLSLRGISQTISNLAFASASLTSVVTGADAALLVTGAAGLNVGALGGTPVVQLDLSGLGAFSYAGAGQSFRVGPAGAAAANALGFLNLAETNTITAAFFGVGDQGLNGFGAGTNTLRLGRINTLQADSVVVGSREAAASVHFRTGLTAPSLELRGVAGGTNPVASMIVGTLNDFTTRTIPATFDTTAGSLDARIGTLVVGQVIDRFGNSVGTLAMGAGTMTATAIILGQNLSSTTTAGIAAGGTFLLSGGEVSVQTLTLSDNVKTNNGIARGTFVLSNGTLRAERILMGRALGTNVAALAWAGGTIANRDAATDLVISNGVAVDLTTAGLHELRVDTDRVATVYATLTGTASLVKAGPGIAVLHALNTYGGGTMISNGALLVNGRVIGPVAVTAAGTLGGTGVVTGVVTLDGIIAPGAGIGTLTISNQVTDGATAVYRFELGGTNAPTDYDQLVVSDVHTLQGTLEVVVTNGYVPASGDRFVILTNSGLGGLLFGTFSSVSGPALDPGLGWEVQYTGTESASLVVTGTVGAVLTPYEQWAQSITNPALRGEQADADGDGYANLLEYSQGTDATNSADNAKLSLVRTNGQFLVLFNRVNSATDIVYEVEGAYLPTNNATWLGIATNVIGSWGGSTNVNDNNTAAVHRVLVTDLLIGTNRSLRLKVTRP